MRLLRLTVLLILAAILVVEPVVHSHPLLPLNGAGSGLTSPSVCAICAVGADTVVLSPAVVIAPAIVVEHLGSSTPRPVSVDSRTTLASRAPPAA